LLGCNDGMTKIQDLKDLLTARPQVLGVFYAECVKD
jgi:hypothetical protein